MDFFDPKKKKARTIRLFMGYCLMAVALLIATVIVWYQTYGYDIDRKTGDIIQKGLIFVDAHPEPATIYLNGEEKGQTDARFTPVAGRYSLELRRAGYRSWQRDFDLYGGTIERFIYPFLFPEKLSVTEKQTYASSPGLVSQSIDRRWLIVLQPGSLTTFEVFDLANADSKPTTITLPADTLTVTRDQQYFEVVEWSSDNRHMLLRHVYGPAEYIMLDRESPADSLNLTKAFGGNKGKFSLRDKKSDQFYVHDTETGVLQTADLRSRTVSPLLTKVIAFRSHGNNTLLYITDTGASAGKVMVKILDGDKDYSLRELPSGSEYLLALAQFNGQWHMAVGAVNEGKVSIYRDPVSDLQKILPGLAKPISTLRVDRPVQLAFSATTARFIMTQGESRFAIYDAERDRQYRYNTKLNISQTEKATWMDGRRISVVSDGKAVVFDFDGTNIQALSPAASGFPVFFNSAYDAFYTLAPGQTPGQTALTRTELIVK